MSKQLHLCNYKFLLVSSCWQIYSSKWPTFPSFPNLKKGEIPKPIMITWRKRRRHQCFCTLLPFRGPSFGDAYVSSSFSSSSSSWQWKNTQESPWRKQERSYEDQSIPSSKTIITSQQPLPFLLFPTLPQLCFHKPLSLLLHPPSSPPYTSVSRLFSKQPASLPPPNFSAYLASRSLKPSLPRSSLFLSPFPSSS